MKKTPEQLVRQAILKYLRHNGHLVLPHRTTAAYDPRRGQYLQMNTDYGTPGESDLLVFAKSSPISPIWIELKKPGKRRLDPNQILFKELVTEWGHEFLVVNCVEDLTAVGL